MTRKLATGSIWTMNDQEKWYRELMGEEITDRQVHMAKKERGECICTRPIKERSVKRIWDGMDKMTTRAIHDPGCPKRKKWMDSI